MRHFWIVPACVATLAGLHPLAALAQASQTETPLYTTQPPTELDKNYGLPTFGMPESELPRQRTLATDRAAPNKAPVVPDFFKGSTEMPSPTDKIINGATDADSTASLGNIRPPASGMGNKSAAASGMQTPLYTTLQGSTTADTPVPDDGTQP